MEQALKDQLYQLIDDKTDELIAIRRYLHQHPEPSFEEKETAKYIANFYAGHDMKVDLQTNIGGTYGLTATIDSGKPGKTIALRADFDALPVKEETGLPFAATNGAMHACGHDGHTAYMLVLAECLYQLKDQWAGKIKIIHQPAEEKAPGGALPMMKAGILHGVDCVVGAHGASDLPVGDILLVPGASSAGSSDFDIYITGVSGHGSAPQNANDATVAASYLVAMAQTIIARRLNPFDMATLTIGQFEGGHAHNVIAGQVHLGGDVRFMKNEINDTVLSWLKKLCQGVEMIFGVKVELKFNTGTLVVDNDPKLTNEVLHTMTHSQLPGIGHIDTTTVGAGAEDFSFFSEEVPTVYWHYGQKPADGISYPHHSSKFLLNEDALPFAAKTMGAIVLDLLAQ
ncbi:MAG: amidohydrolase [Lactobacillus sp.]|jgi:amidohydrolase|nr:amidohydrolase [Lactobacillus sp.]MCH3905938.1 amidohydrolase [Lactobacillus sp.]MCH3990488.1 amidohydrolase [Lactobacillus sp.]MCH4068797.1 amidohydrolase [Lactobacillus sp.]MCI1304422.1 amidohydrolase [Lactobacillus sp.]